MTIARVLWLVSLTCALLTGCGDDDDDIVGDGDADADADADVDGDADADGDGDGDADGDGDVDLSSVTVRVFTQDALGVRTPAAGAAVAFDPIGAERIEQTADSKGWTTFEDLDWTGDGVAAVMAYLEGWQVGGRVALTADYVEGEIARAGELVVVLGANPGSLEGLVEIHGTATMIDGTSHLLAVSAVGRGATFVGQGPDWSTYVAADEPFTLVAVEWGGGWNEEGTIFDQPFYEWQLVEHDGVSVPTEIDVDFLTAPVEELEFSGTIERQADTIGTFWEGALPFPLVYSLTGGMGLFSGSRFGWIGEAHDADGTNAPAFTYEGDYHEVDVVADPGTILYWFNGALASIVALPGYPTNGAQDVEYLEPPDLLTPLHGGDRPLRPGPPPHLFGDTLEWELGAADAANEAVEVMLVLYSADLANNLTTVFAPPGTTSLALPRPPSAVDPAELYGDAATAQVMLCELDDAGRICLRQATSRLLTLEGLTPAGL